MRPSSSQRLLDETTAIGLPLTGDVVACDDFESPRTGARQVFAAYAVRNVAKHVTAELTIDPVGWRAPSAVIVSTLNQAGTAAWELSWDHSTWVAGDAGTAIGAGLTVKVPPNSLVAPFMRLTFTAGVAPGAGTLTALVSEPSPDWTPVTTYATVAWTGEEGHVVRLDTIPTHVYAGHRSLFLHTRTLGPQLNDIIEATRRMIPLPVGGAIEVGALVCLVTPEAWTPSSPGNFQMALDLFIAGAFAGTVGLDWDKTTNIVRALGAGSSFVSTDLKLQQVPSGVWVDFRFAVDLSSGAYLYVEVDRLRRSLSNVSVGAPGIARGWGAIGQPRIIVKATTAAVTVGAWVDRWFVRRIG